MPKADVIFITHTHSDHYDVKALNKIRTDSTLLVCPQAVKALGTYTGPIQVMNNGDSATIKGIPIKAVPAYNTSNSNHVKGAGNGYILTFGEKRIYIGGDTKIIPAMDSLGTIDIAFLPMNLPYTMSASMAADAAKKIQPSIVYIYHFTGSDTSTIRGLLSDQHMVVRMGRSIFYESDKRQSTGLRQNGEIRRARSPIATIKNPLNANRILYDKNAVFIDMKGRMLRNPRQNDVNKKVFPLCTQGAFVAHSREANANQLTIGTK
jgi:L-ascorbate metabolism protein UlaG (beta-lactamase superfamily)